MSVYDVVEKDSDFKKFLDNMLRGVIGGKVPSRFNSVEETYVFDSNNYDLFPYLFSELFSYMYSKHYVSPDDLTVFIDDCRFIDENSISCGSDCYKLMQDINSNKNLVSIERLEYPNKGYKFIVKNSEFNIKEDKFKFSVSMRKYSQGENLRISLELKTLTHSYEVTKYLFNKS